MAVSPESKMLTPDRVMLLSPMDGKTPKSSIGQTDPRLLTGENKIHILKEVNTNFWYFKYEMGGVPEALKCKFTGFKQALKHAENYFAKRNILIKEAA